MAADTLRPAIDREIETEVNEVLEEHYNLDPTKLGFGQRIRMVLNAVETQNENGRV